MSWINFLKIKLNYICEINNRIDYKTIYKVYNYQPTVLKMSSINCYLKGISTLMNSTTLLNWEKGLYLTSKVSLWRQIEPKHSHKS